MILFSSIFCFVVKSTSVIAAGDVIWIVFDSQHKSSKFCEPVELIVLNRTNQLQSIIFGSEDIRDITNFDAESGSRNLLSPAKLEDDQ